MTGKNTDAFFDEVLCKDIRVMIEMLGSLSNSYRLLVGGAEELNHIALVHKHDAKEAIDRADDLGEIIDDVQDELRRLMKLYLRELSCKLEVKQLCSSKLVEEELVEDLENQYIREEDKK